MNRTTVVFLALAILLAHTLALHQAPDGSFAPPYEHAHVAFRVGRNIVHEGQAAWNPRSPWSETYPSVAWTAVCAAAERVSFSPIRATQWLGILTGLGTIIVLAQFSPKRLSGLIAPTLLAASGGAAAAAASGTEAPLAGFLLTLGFLAFERGWRRTFGATLAALVLTRPESVPVGLALLALEFVDRPRGTSSLGAGPGEGRPPFARAFLPAVVFLAAIVSIRASLGYGWLSAYAAEAFRVDPERWLLGLHYLLGFLTDSGTGLLIVLPLLFLAVGWLDGTGRRSLLVFCVWAAAVMVSGGDGLPFWNSLAPALPLFFLSVQSAFVEAMDRRPQLAGIAWCVLLFMLGASLLVSKSPGDIGPIPLERLQRAWLDPSEPMRAAYDTRNGREGLELELERVERLRTVGVFLRDKVAPNATVATFWPGAISYLSHKEVVDLLGRTRPSTPGDRVRSFQGVPRVDLAANMGLSSDYVVPMIDGVGEGNVADILGVWLRRYDVIGDTPERRGELMEILRRYELVSVPVAEVSTRPNVPSSRPFLLLRRKDLGRPPTLEVKLGPSGRSFAVLMRHQGHREVVNLRVSVIADEDGRRNLRPTGAWTTDDSVDTRVNVMAYDTGTRAVTLVEGQLPPDVDARWLTARLFNPSVRSESALASVGSPVRVPLR